MTVESRNGAPTSVSQKTIKQLRNSNKINRVGNHQGRNCVFPNRKVSISSKSQSRFGRPQKQI